MRSSTRKSPACNSRRVQLCQYSYFCTSKAIKLSTCNTCGPPAQQPQRANYLLADDVRKTGIHDAILAAVKRHQHPLMRECALLHHLVAAPT